MTMTTPLSTTVDVVLVREKGKIVSALNARDGAPVSWIQRIIDGQCPECGASHGLGPNERHRLPRVDRGDRWEFIAPCGHAVLGIKKGSDLAKQYGLIEGTTQ